MGPLAPGPSSTGCRWRPTVSGRRSVFVQPEEETQSALWTWGGRHAGLWIALRATGHAVDIVAVGRNAERLAAAERRQGLRKRRDLLVAVARAANSVTAASQPASIAAGVATQRWSTRSMTPVGALPLLPESPGRSTCVCDPRRGLHDHRRGQRLRPPPAGNLPAPSRRIAAIPARPRCNAHRNDWRTRLRDRTGQRQGVPRSSCASSSAVCTASTSARSAPAS